MGIAHAYLTYGSLFELQTPGEPTLEFIVGFIMIAMYLQKSIYWTGFGKYTICNDYDVWGACVHLGCILLEHVELSDVRSWLLAHESAAPSHKLLINICAQVL